MEFEKKRGLRSLQTHTSYEESEFHVHCRPQVPRLSDTLRYSWQIYADTFTQHIKYIQDRNMLYSLQTS